VSAKTWRCARCGWLNPSDAKACASCSRSVPRTKKAKPPPVFRPWRAVILSVDVAERSGWAVWACGKLAASGEFRIYSSDGVVELLRVVEVAKSLALRMRVPWCAVFERSWGGHMGLGSTKALGFWMFPLRNAQLHESAIGLVYPATWRARVLPRGMHSAKREVVREAEVAAARALVAGRDCGHDEAPAILIGKWSTQAGEVGLLLPKNERRTT